MRDFHNRGKRSGHAHARTINGAIAVNRLKLCATMPAAEEPSTFDTLANALIDQTDILKAEKTADDATQESDRNLDAKIATAEQLRACLTEARRDPTSVTAIPAGKLLLFAQTLRRLVDNGKGCDLVENQGDGTSGVSGESSEHQWRCVAVSLESAILALTLMSIPGVDRRMIAEDHIEQVVQLCKEQLTRHVFPALYSGFLNAAKVDNKKPRRSTPGISTGGSSPVKRPRKRNGALSSDQGVAPSKAPPPLHARSEAAYASRLGSLSAQLCELFAALRRLLHVTSLDDSILLQLSAVGLSTFFVDVTSSSGRRKSNATAILAGLQHAALRLMCTLFQCCETHRELILDEVLGSMVKLPTTKRLHRTYELYDHVVTAPGPYAVDDGAAQSCIQMVTALVVQLVQCSSGIPPLFMVADTADSEASEDEGMMNGTSVPPCRRDHRAAVAVSTYFLRYFLKRCTRGAANFKEYSSLLGNFADDLLAALHQPEWPAAELLLELLCKLLSSHLSKHDGNSTRAQKAGHSFNMQALDLLGRILARVHRDVRLTRENPVIMPSKRTVVNVLGRPDDDEEQIACVCGEKNFGGRFMLDCDVCHRWSHGSCVGVDENKPPTSWVCDECAILQQASLQRSDLLRGSLSARRHSHLQGQAMECDDGSKSHLDSDHSKDGGETGNGRSPELGVYRQLYLNYLAERLPIDPDGLINAYIYCLGQFHDAERSCTGALRAPESQECTALRSQWEGLESNASMRTVTSSKARPVLSRRGTINVVRQLAALRHGGLCSLSQSSALLRRMLALLSVGQPSFRARSIKALACVVAADPAQMGNDFVKSAVEQRVMDEAISVRDAALELVGRFVLDPHDKDSASKYLAMLINRLQDSGVSVRKRAVKILRDLIIEGRGKTLSIEHLMRICRSLSLRVTDVQEEDSIKDLVLGTFRELWFSSNNVHLKLNSASDVVAVARGNSSPVPKPRAEGSAASNAADVTPPSLLPASSPTSDATDVSDSYSEVQVDRHNGIDITVLSIIDIVESGGGGNWFMGMLEGLLRNRDAPSDSALEITDSDDGVVAQGRLHATTASARRARCRAQRVHDTRTTCSALVVRLINFLVELEEGKLPIAWNQSGSGAVGCSGGAREKVVGEKRVAIVRTLRMFCAAWPGLLVAHASVLAPYLAVEEISADDEVQLLNEVASMLTMVLPSWHRPPTGVTRKLGKDLVRLIYTKSAQVLPAAVECAAALTKCGCTDVSMLHEVLQRFYAFLHRHRNSVTFSKRTTACNVERALYACGLLCRFFDFEAGSSQSEESIVNDELEPTGGDTAQLISGDGLNAQVYRILVHYLHTVGVAECSVRKKAVQGLGCLFVRRPRLLLCSSARRIVGSALREESNTAIRVQMLFTFADLLEAEELRLEGGRARAELEARTSLSSRVQGDQDAEAGVLGGVVQQNVDLVLKLAFDGKSNVRNASLVLLGIMLRQGLVNPLLCMEQLVALHADHDAGIASAAYNHIVTVHEKHPDFLITRFLIGIFRSFEFQKTVFGSTRAVVASGEGTGNEPSFSVFGRLYRTCIRPHRKHRKRFIESVVNLFDTSSGNSGGNIVAREVRPLPLLHYVAETAATLPYTYESEPLYVVYLVNRLVSLRGSVLIEELGPVFAALRGEDRQVDIHSVNLAWVERRCHYGAALCLLLQLKHFLKQSYCLGDAKCSSFTPWELNSKNDKQLVDSGAGNLPEFYSLSEATGAVQQGASGGHHPSERELKDLLPTFVQIEQMLQEDPADMQLQLPHAKPASKKRTSNADRKSKAIVSNKRRKARKASNNGESFDDDSDWEM